MIEKEWVIEMVKKFKLVKIIAALVATLLVTISLTLPVFAAPSQAIYRVNTSTKVVSFTFDDGSDGGHINEILAILAKNNIKATFFLTGAATQQHPNLIRNIVNQGHEIGNHSFNHPDFAKISTAQMKDQLNRTETIVKNATGKTTKPLFRPPFGASNTTVLNAVGDAGYTKTIMWTIDTVDWRGDSAATMTNKVVNNIVPGAIILMHTGQDTFTPEALPGMISKLKSLGYKFVPVSQLLTYQGSPTTGRTHTVKSGETLYSIALRYSVTVQQLVATNRLANPNLIRVGQVLAIPGTGGTTPTPPSITRHTVRAGETLYGIALRYGVTVQQIVTTNKITNPSLIRVGQVLTIPTRSQTPPTTTIKYTVKAGDTLYRIGQKYNTTALAIARANNIANLNLIRVGQVLTIPK